MALQPTPIPLRFPLGGISENAAYAGDPKPLAVRAEHVLNCRAYDSMERRARGGQRSGLKAIADAILTGASVQDLRQVVEAIPINQSAGYGVKYTLPTVSIGNFNGIRWHPDGDKLAFVDKDSGVTIYDVDTSAKTVTSSGNTLAVATVISDGGNNDDFVACRWSADGAHLAVSTGGNLVVYPYDDSTGFGTGIVWTGVTNCYEVDFSSDNAAIVVLDGDTNSQPRCVAWTGSAFGSTLTAASTTLSGALANVGVENYRNYLLVSPANDFVVGRSEGGGVRAWAFSSSTGFGSQYSDPASNPTPSNSSTSFDIHPEGTFVVGSTSDSTSSSDEWWFYPFDSSTGWGNRTDGPSNSGSGSSVSLHPDATHVLLQISGVEVHAFTSTVGSAVSNPSGFPGGTNYGTEFSPQGDAIAWAVGGGGTTGEGLLVWEWNPAATNPSARESTIVATAGGTVQRSDTEVTAFTTVSNGNGALSGSGTVQSALAFQNLFFVDGLSANYQYLDLSSNVLKDWATDITAGSLPEGSSDSSIGCQIITVWRGRVVLSGLQEDPQNWFMSRSGDPFDYDYSPSVTTATQAVAGNASDAGKLGDVVTALAPHQDDLLFIGGANTLWLMRGDPAAGGEIDNISRSIGIVGPEAFTWDTAGTLYFFGRNGLYRMQANASQPQLVSQNKLDRTFSDIDLSSNVIRLVYDVKWQGVHVFNSPAIEPDEPASHYFWDQRTDSWWRDQYPINVGPTAVLSFGADQPSDRAVILGGYDGVLRSFDDDADDDDGTAIESFARLPMLHPKLPAGQFQLVDHQITTDRNGGASTKLSIFRGRTPEEAAFDATAEFTRTLAAGRNLPSRSRIRANAIQMELRNEAADETWAYEDGTAVIAGVGRQRAGL